MAALRGLAGAIFVVPGISSLVQHGCNVLT
jgi:hypothetical protein